MQRKQGRTFPSQQATHWHLRVLRGARYACTVLGVGGFVAVAGAAYHYLSVDVGARARSGLGSIQSHLGALSNLYPALASLLERSRVAQTLTNIDSSATSCDAVLDTQPLVALSDGKFLAPSIMCLPTSVSLLPRDFGTRTEPFEVSHPGQRGQPDEADGSATLRGATEVLDVPKPVLAARPQQRLARTFEQGVPTRQHPPTTAALALPTRPAAPFGLAANVVPSSLVIAALPEVNEQTSAAPLAGTEPHQHLGSAIAPTVLTDKRVVLRESAPSSDRGGEKKRGTAGRKSAQAGQSTTVVFGFSVRVGKPEWSEEIYLGRL